jgi:hypothetical protein
MGFDKVFSIVGMTLASMLMQVTSATAAVLLLQAGAVGKPNVAFEVDQSKAPKQLFLRTDQAGVAGSALDVSIDGRQKPALHHIFTVDECRFVEQQSRCEVNFAIGGIRGTGQRFNQRSASAHHDRRRRRDEDGPPRESEGCGASDWAVGCPGERRESWHSRCGH